MSLPTDAKSRKALPICTGVLDYFPDAIAAVAHCSRVGNDQHNPGEPLHWARGKSTDQRDSAVRHIMDGLKTPIDSDGVWHLAKAAWRILAQLQLEIEAAQAPSVASPPGREIYGTPTEALYAPLRVGPIGKRPDPYGCVDGTDF